MLQLSKSVAASWAIMLAVGLGMFHAGEAGAAEVRLGGMVPGAGVIHKTVTSMREEKFSDLVRQQTDFSCGAAALATIFRYAYGMNTDEEDVLRGLLKISDIERVYAKGFSLLDLKNYAESKGLQAAGFEVGPEVLDDLKIPTIVLLDIKGYQHFVVLKKTSGDRVYVGDPALGNNVLSRGEFVSAWNGVVLAMVGENYDESTILRQPAEPLSARKLLGFSAPVDTANLLDYGYLHADLMRF